MGVVAVIAAFVVLAVDCGGGHRASARGNILTPAQVKASLVRDGATIVNYVPSAPDPRLVFPHQIGDIGASLPNAKDGGTGGAAVWVFDSEANATAEASTYREKIQQAQSEAPGQPAIHLIQHRNVIALLSSILTAKQIATYRHALNSA